LSYHTAYNNIMDLVELVYQEHSTSTDNTCCTVGPIPGWFLRRSVSQRRRSKRHTGL